MFIIVNIWIDCELFFVLKIRFFLKRARFLAWITLLWLNSCLPVVDSYHLMTFIGCLRHIWRLIHIIVLVCLLAVSKNLSLWAHFNLQLFNHFLFSIYFLLFWLLILIILGLFLYLFLIFNLFMLNLFFLVSIAII